MSFKNNDCIFGVSSDGKHGYGDIENGQLSWKPEINLDTFHSFELWLGTAESWKTKHISKTDAKHIFRQ